MNSHGQKGGLFPNRPAIIGTRAQPYGQSLRRHGTVVRGRAAPPRRFSLVRHLSETLRALPLPETALIVVVWTCVLAGA
jgi:hypothetical protein